MTEEVLTAEQVDQSDPNQADAYVLLWNVALEDDVISIDESLELRKLEAPISYWDLLAATASGFHQGNMLEGIVHRCTTELYSRKREGVSGNRGFDTLNRAWLVSALLCLRGFTRHLGVAVSGYSWDVIAGHHERNQIRQKEWDAAKKPFDGRPKFIEHVPDFRGNLLDFHMKLIRVSSERNEEPVNREDAKWIAKYFDAADRLANNTRFYIALAAATDWRFQVDGRAAISRLWSGIEAILNVDTEITYRLAVTAASLLEPRGKARLERFNAIKRLYGHRSKAVHGNQLSRDAISQAVDASFDLLRDLIVLSLEQGHIPRKDDIERSLFY